MNTELLAFIEKKEAEEKRKKRIRILISSGLVMALAVGAIFGWPMIKGQLVEQLTGQDAAYMQVQKIALRQENQQLYPEEIGENGPFIEVDQRPQYPGGEPALYRFLSQQIRYPDLAARQRIEGSVLVRFVIEDDGKVAKAEIVNGIGMGCDEEALRVIKNMPHWIPGQKEGKTVPVYSSLAVNFKFLQ